MHRQELIRVGWDGLVVHDRYCARGALRTVPLSLVVGAATKSDLMRILTHSCGPKLRSLRVPLATAARDGGALAVDRHGPSLSRSRRHVLLCLAKSGWGGSLRPPDLSSANRDCPGRAKVRT